MKDEQLLRAVNLGKAGRGVGAAIADGLPELFAGLRVKGEGHAIDESQVEPARDTSADADYFESGCETCTFDKAQIW